MLLNEYIQSKEDFQGWRILEFCDDGYSGTNFERPGFQKMMAMVKLKQLGCIVVKDLSRFGREYLEVSSYLELILPIFDIRFISVNDHFDSNAYIGTTGGMELAFRNLINSMYSRDISVKVKTARKTRERKGEYIGGHPFYGYLKDPSDRHHLIVDETVRPVIEDIFDMSIQGMSTMEIARALNERNIPCPVEHKKARGISYSKKLTEEKAVWIQCTVRKILRDERYTGKMVANVRSSAAIGKNVMCNNKRSDWIIVEDTHEAIISENVFQEANTALASRVRVVNRNTNWKKSGNLFVCGCCGRKLQKSKGKDIYLYCQKARYMPDGECGNIHVDISTAQNSVLAIIRRMGQIMSDGTVIRRKTILLNAAQLEKEAERIKKQLQKHTTDKGLLYENYKAGHMTKEAFIEAQERSRQEKVRLEQSLKEKLEEAEKRKREQKKFQQAEEELRTAAFLTEYDPEAVGQLVEKVIVYEGGRVELVMKNRDMYEMMTQSEIVLQA